MEIMNKVERFIFESRTWQFILVIAAISLFKTGIWYMPNIGISDVIAKNPFVNPFTNPLNHNVHYLFWNWLGSFLAWLVGATGKWQFLVFHLFFSIAFTLLFIRVIFANFAGDTARSAIVLFSILPVSGTAYFWVGMDSVTLFLMLLALAFPSARILAFIIGILLGMQHFEQGFFAALGLFFAVFLSHKQKYKLKYSVAFCLLFLLGVIAGKFCLMGIFKYYGIELHFGRKDWMAANLHALLNQFFFHFHYILWSVLGLGWCA